EAAMAAMKQEPQERAIQVSQGEQERQEEQERQAARTVAPPSHRELLRQAAQGFASMRNIARLAAKCVTDADDAAPEGARMGAGQSHALSALYEQSPLMAGELAERCHVAEPTISKMLRSLEAGGLIERRTDPTNRRVVWVNLTPAGRAMRDKMVARFVGMLTHVLDPLDNALPAGLIAASRHL